MESVVVTVNCGAACQALGAGQPWVGRILRRETVDAVRRHGDVGRAGMRRQVVAGHRVGIVRGRSRCVEALVMRGVHVGTSCGHAGVHGRRAPVLVDGASIGRPLHAAVDLRDGRRRSHELIGGVGEGGTAAASTGRPQRRIASSSASRHCGRSHVH